jgi:hypothetical protein
MLRRRHWNVSNVLHYVLWHTRATEYWMHLFFHCNFSIRIWTYLQIEWEPGSTFEIIFSVAHKISVILSSPKWVFQQLGIFGSRETSLFFKEFCYRLGDGRGVLFWRSLCISIEWKRSMFRVCQDGLALSFSFFFPL